MLHPTGPIDREAGNVHRLSLRDIHGNVETLGETGAHGFFSECLARRDVGDQVRVLITRAGEPTTRVWAGTSRITVVPAPTVAPAPTQRH